MATPDFTFTEGAVPDPFIATIRDSAGTAVDFTNATNIVWNLRNRVTGALDLDSKPAAVYNAPGTDGKLTFVWSQSAPIILLVEALPAGDYDGQFEWDDDDNHYPAPTVPFWIRVEPSVDRADTSNTSVYPTGAALENYLRSLDVLDEDNLETILARFNLDEKMQTARDEWEKRVSWRPFLAVTSEDEPDGVVTIRYYDPPGPTRNFWWVGGGQGLALRAGLITLQTLTLGVTPDTTGQVLVENQSFWLKDLTGRYDFAVRGRPAEAVEFWWKVWGPRRSIKIEGVFGFCTALPKDVYEAVLFYGAALCFPQLSLQVSSGLYETADRNSKLRYAGGKMSPLAEQILWWERKFEEKVQDYSREPV